MVSSDVNTHVREHRTGHDPESLAFVKECDEQIRAAAKAQGADSGLFHLLDDAAADIDGWTAE